MAQVQHVSRSIEWQKLHNTTVDDTVYKYISFKGAIYSSANTLPVWSESFYIESYSDNVFIDQCVFAPVSNDELQLIQAAADMISDTVTISSGMAISQKQSGVHVEILPFIKDKISGKYSKLVSFRLNFAELGKAKESLTRAYAANSVLSQGDWYKLAITQTGIYSLGYDDLVAMGINPANLDPGKIGIFGRGGAMLPESNAKQRPDDLPEIAIEVIGQQDGVFNQEDRILFYAQGPVTWNYDFAHKFWGHTTHLYTDTICYFLTTDQGSGKRIASKNSSAATETDVVNSFDYYTLYEENKFNLIGSGRLWFAQIFDVLLNRSFPFTIPPLDAGGDVKLYSYSAAKSVISSSFAFSVGDQKWTVSHPPIPIYPDHVEAYGAGVYKSLQSVALPLVIDVKYNKTSASGEGYLDYLDVNARCNLTFVSGQFDFRDSHSYGSGHVSSYHLGNAAGKVRLWEVTDPLKSFSLNASTDGNDLIFKLSSDTLRQFVAFDESKLLKPVFLNKVPNQDLHALTGADMIILSPQLFMSQAVRLATFHATQSDLDVLVLDPTTIYNEFSSGTVDITAIRDFLKMLYDKAPTVKMPKYLLLFGDGSYDYKNVIASNTNYILTWESPESFDPIKSLVTDDYYGTLDDNEGASYSDVIDIGIGRLPVKTPLEAEQAVDKIIHYVVPSNETSGDWRNIITFLADDEDDDFVSYSELMAKNIETSEPAININKIYLDSFIQVSTPVGNRYPEANLAITQQVEKGCLIINYIGHGGEKGLAHEEALTVNEINNWSNYNNLPVFVTATCEFSRFDDPERQAAGELVLTNPKGGGIALFTTSRSTFGTPNFELNKKFFQYAGVQPGVQRLRMGEIIMNSKRDQGSNENGRKFVLLGDPAMNIGFPSLKVLTTKINNHLSGDGTDTLKAYEKIIVQGVIADNSGNIITDFNGTVIPSVFDKSSTLKTLGNDGGTIFTFKLQKNLLYKGKVNVVNGHFSFTFVVPKDIGYQYGQGKISYYAYDGTRDANGFYSSIIVGGSSDSVLSDNNGPDIKLYMNSLMFRDGGVTDQNPKLLIVVLDENGINTIGNGIGHDITAVLDGNTTEPFILNEFYEADVNTYKSGYIWFPFSLLSAGEHTLKVKVWDVFNNSTEAEIHFFVHLSGEFVITNSYNFPNPFNDYTDIVFEHNQQNIDFDIHAEIYTLTGKPVRTIEQSAPQTGSVSTAVRWDGRNDQGSSVPSGMYFYKLAVRTSTGLFAQSTGKLIYNK